VLRELALHHKSEMQTAGPALLRALRRVLHGNRSDAGRGDTSARRRRTG
jgi:hypothetical protein